MHIRYNLRFLYRFITFNCRVVDRLNCFLAFVAARAGVGALLSLRQCMNFLDIKNKLYVYKYICLYLFICCVRDIVSAIVLGILC